MALRNKTPQQQISNSRNTVALRHIISQVGDPVDARAVGAALAA
jgi:hypothetical protein